MTTTSAHTIKTKPKKKTVSRHIKHTITSPSNPKTKKATPYERRYFLPHARINRGQRKYCHCLMKARPNSKNVYAVCQSMRNRVASQARTQKAKRQLTFNLASTNCVMSYDFDDYSLEEIQALAHEKNIPIYYKISKQKNKSIPKSKSTSINKPYSKDKLVEKLTQYYLSSKAKSKTKSKKIA